MSCFDDGADVRNQIVPKKRSLIALVTGFIAAFPDISDPTVAKTDQIFDSQRRNSPPVADHFIDRIVHRVPANGYDRLISPFQLLQRVCVALAEYDQSVQSCLPFTGHFLNRLRDVFRPASPVIREDRFMPDRCENALVFMNLAFDHPEKFPEESIRLLRGRACHQHIEIKNLSVFCLRSHFQTASGLVRNVLQAARDVPNLLSCPVIRAPVLRIIQYTGYSRD